MEFDDDDDDDDRTTMAATASYCDPMTGWLHTEMVVGIDDCAMAKDEGPWRDSALRALAKRPVPLPFTDSMPCRRCVDLAPTPCTASMIGD